jgi:hypothetical protein
MYTINAKIHKWWDEIHLIVWGPSSKLLSENESLQDNIRSMLKNGIEVTACKACADSYEVSEKLEDLGIEVKYMGVPLTDYIKNDFKVITF